MSLGFTTNFPKERLHSYPAMHISVFVELSTKIKTNTLFSLRNSFPFTNLNLTSLAPDNQVEK